jgi:hypothetical protein
MSRGRSFFFEAMRLRMSGFSTSCSATPDSAAPFSLSLVCARGRPPVGDRCDRDEDVRRELRLYRIMHLDRGLDLHRRHAVGNGKLRRAGDQTHIRAQPRQRLGDGIALLAGRMIGDEAHRIERLARRAGGDHGAEAGEGACA